MKRTSIFDIISPVMVGPSSSHTAGAVRLGLLARNIYNKPFKKVVFKLYNSYAQTGKGHGTSKGLLAGVLGLKVDDRRIKNIFEDDISKNVKYKFEYLEDFKKHPNSVEFIFDNDMTIYGESVGAGEVVVRSINDFYVKLAGKYNTLMIVHKDSPGMISSVTKLIQEKDINIASLHCDRNAKGEDASMCICIDGELDTSIMNIIKKMKDVYFVTYIKRLED